MALDLQFCFDIPDLHLIYWLLLTLARPDVVLTILNLRFSYFSFPFVCIPGIEWHIPFWATQTMLVQYIWPRSLGNVMICLQFLVPHLNLCLSGAAERGEQLVGVQECASQRVPSPPPEDLEPRGWSASTAGWAEEIHYRTGENPFNKLCH